MCWTHEGRHRLNSEKLERYTSRTRSPPNPAFLYTQQTMALHFFADRVGNASTLFHGRLELRKVE